MGGKFYAVIFPGIMAGSYRESAIPLTLEDGKGHHRGGDGAHPQETGDAVAGQDFGGHGGKVF